MFAAGALHRTVLCRVQEDEEMPTGEVEDFEDAFKSEDGEEPEGTGDGEGSEEPVDESDVTDLDDSTFSAFIEKNPATLVKFYAPWLVPATVA